MEDIDVTPMFDRSDTPLPASSPLAEDGELEASPPVKASTRKRRSVAVSESEGDAEGTKSTPKKKKAKSARNGGAQQTRQRKVRHPTHDALIRLAHRSLHQAPAKPAAAARPIPRSYDECDAADTMLMKWRDEGVLWPEIRTEWTKITGEKSGVSTLPNRYVRLKINCANIKEEDNAKLLQSKLEIEAAFEKEKWDTIAQGIVDKGGDTYIVCLPPSAVWALTANTYSSQPEVLHYQYKKIMLNAGVAPPPSVADNDFDYNVQQQFPIEGEQTDS